MAGQQFHDLNPLAKAAAVILVALLGTIAVGVTAIILGFIYRGIVAVWT